jgi:hypothetical protein
MQSNLERGRAASGARSAGRFVAIFAGVPLIAILVLGAPDRARAACGTIQPAGSHAASAGTGGAHTATSKPPTSGSDSGGGGGSLGCANGSSAEALHGLPTAASGKVVEGGAHAAAHTTTRTATTRTSNTGAHLRGVKPPHA